MKNTNRDTRKVNNDDDDNNNDKIKLITKKDAEVVLFWHYALAMTLFST